MCGIIGLVEPHSTYPSNDKFLKALSHLNHRGPNAKDYRILSSHAQSSVFLGHTRLSIIDLAEHANQPMVSSDGRYTLIFNGEIYNYKELRETLQEKGYSFQTTSDTEVLLYAWACWGEASISYFNGMFAFVIFDEKEQMLYGVRDPFGIKPFFYTHENNQLMFGSEIKAILALQSQKPRPYVQAAYDYLVHGKYDHQEHTFFENIKQLPPGHLLKLDVNAIENLYIQRWHQLKINPLTLDFNSACEQFRHQFLENIRLHLRSDVPLGAALSGGLDSSAIVCGIRHLEPDLPLNTFSYIAKGSSLSEERYVDMVNQHVGAQAHHVYFCEKNFLNDLENIIQVQDEPFGSTSIYAQYLVFQKAKEQNITVTLDGQGADELLAGYNGYPSSRIKSLIENRQFLESLSFAYHWGKNGSHRNLLKSSQYYLNAILPSQVSNQLRYQLSRGSLDWLNEDYLNAFNVNRIPQDSTFQPHYKGYRLIERLEHALQTDGLPSLLRHGDRNSMRFSIESRVPFLTTPMAELLLSMPESYLISPKGQTKYLLREALRGIVPQAILDRKDKIGFETPEKNILLNLSKEILALLNAGYDIPIFNAKPLKSQIHQMLQNNRKYSSLLWRWVNFIKWYQIQNF